MAPFPLITPDFTDRLVAIARAAGEAIMAIYRQPDAGDIQTKQDDSPLTAADLAAHRLIAAELPRLLDVPMISEEAVIPSLAVRRGWEAYWLIDPLDGTKEFIARNGEFTVNIALVVDGTPLLGVVHVPVSDETYLGLDKGIAADGATRAEKYLAGIKQKDLQTRSLRDRFAASAPLELVVSHRHGSEAQVELLQKLQSRWPAPLHHVSAGSSLKFCLIAEGRADFYPRLAPTSEWDTAAAQAVLTAAGGLVVTAEGLQPLEYNRRQSVLNPWFLALADAGFNWDFLLN